MVKFGHDLEQTQASFGEGFKYDLFNYKQLKKFLKFTRNWASDDSSMDEECQSKCCDTQDIRIAARAHLCSDFWEWEDEEDGHFLVEEWIEKVFIAHFQRESSRVRKSIDLQVGILEEYNDKLLELKRESTKGTRGSEECAREVMDLQRSMISLQNDMTTYISVNHTACFKILKKHDKLFPASKLMSSLMPCVNEDLGSVLTKDRMSQTFESSELLSPDRAKVYERLVCTQKRLQRELRIVEPDLTSRVSELVLAVPSLQVNVFPLVQALRSNYGLQDFQSDIMSAIVVSVAGIPKAMSYAALCGLPFAQGIPTLYVPCLVYFLLGSSRQGCISPLSVPCLMLAEMLDQALAESRLEGAELMAERIHLALMYTTLTGLVIFSFGLLQLGFLLHFVPKPVLSGFVSASALIAALAALKGLLKIHVEKSQVLFVLAGNIYDALPETHAPTAIMSLLSILMLLFLPMVQKRIIQKTTEGTRFTSRMLNKACKLPAILLLVACGMLFGATLCDFTPLTLWQPNHILIGRGASLPATLLQETAERFNCSFSDERAGAVYVASGSKDGIDAITEDSLSVDFAVSEIEPPPEVMKQHGITSVPLVTNAICPVVNLPILDNHGNAELILDLSTISDIFEGRIKHWTDKRIVSLNPNLRWDAAPNKVPIVVVSRSDASGTTHSFANILKNCSSCNSSISPGFHVPWGAPVQAFQAGNAGVVAAVADIDWSIGYAGLAAVQESQTLRAESPARCAIMRTSVGLVRASSVASTSADGQQRVWPMSIYSYMLVPRARRVTSQFPRVETCKARTFLKSFLDKIFDRKSSVTASNVLPAPSLDHIHCSNEDATKDHAEGRTLVASNQASRGFLSSNDRQDSATSPSSDALERRLKEDACSKGKSYLCGTFKVVGFIEVSFPAPTWLFGHELSVDLPITDMLMGALLLAIVTLLEHVANVKLYSERNDYQISTSGDLMALGLSNIAGAMFGSVLVAAGFSRSALNAKAKSQVALGLSTIISFGIVCLIAPLLSMLPDFILNAILFMAVIHLVDYKMVRDLFRLRRVGGQFDLLALCIAFVATCCLGVVMGMMISIAFSLVTFIFNASYPRILERRRRLGETHYCTIEQPATGCLAVGPPSPCEITKEELAFVNERIKVLRFEAPMWFANVHHLTDRVLSELKTNSAKPLELQWKAIVLDMSTVPWLDASAGMTLKKIIESAKSYKVNVVFACVAEGARGMIKANCGIWGNQCFATVYEAAVAMQENRVSQTNSE